MELDFRGMVRPRAWPQQLPANVNPWHPEYRRESIYAVAMSSMDVCRAEWARWLYDHEKISDGKQP